MIKFIRKYSIKYDQIHIYVGKTHTPIEDVGRMYYRDSRETDNAKDHKKCLQMGQDIYNFLKRNKIQK